MDRVEATPGVVSRALSWQENLGGQREKWGGVRSEQGERWREEWEGEGTQHAPGALGIALGFQAGVQEFDEVGCKAREVHQEGLAGAQGAILVLPKHQGVQKQGVGLVRDLHAQHPAGTARGASMGL